MNVSSIAVTGAAGLVGQPLLQVLADHPDVTRVVGLDVREPARRPRGSEFHRVDIAGTRLAPLLEGIDVIVHLAGVVDPIPDEALMARVNVGGTRQVLDAAAAVGAKRIVRHNVTNIRFTEIGRSEARVACYFTVVTEIGLDHYGRYRDVFVPVGDDWLIRHRFVSTDWSAPDSTMARTH